MKWGGGRGRGPDLAEKPGFSNFFGHFGPLARPMEGCVDFYHTNFSRRSHPCYPGIFAAEPDVEKLTFWADFGPTLGRPWADSGPLLDRLWADFGWTLG